MVDSSNKKMVPTAIQGKTETMMHSLEVEGGREVPNNKKT